MARFLIILVTGALVAACGVNPGDGRESGGDKLESSILQGLAFETREQVASGLDFRMIDGYDVLGVPRHEDSRPVWVMLNPAHPPFYKQVPSGNFSLDRKQLDEIIARGSTISTVAEALRSHLTTE